ncbi:MAG: DNA gyrase subunit A [Chloroflexi bacterium]|nr:DNA gyrase subunit A [Chloroflexota bacterium]
MAPVDRMVPVPIEDEMKESYIDYAMSVIMARALPDVRDGLKPVQRRILFSMSNMGMTPDKPHKKSATIVGDVIGKYHPHGDQAIYDALVRMAQDFNMRYPLVDGHGNFGSVDGDPAAAYRYTEARLSKIAMTILKDLEKDTVDFRPNFDSNHNEPVVLPSGMPNLLVNGSGGIAVGMATNIPPHNLGEVIDALELLINEPGCSLEELINIVPAPDFPTGALILGLEGAKQAYTTGRGSVIMRAKTEIQPFKGSRHRIIVNAIPYQVNKSRLLEDIALKVREKIITGVTDLRDESDRHGMRIVIELGHNVNPNITLNQLFKHTYLQTSFGVILLALVEGVPRMLNLKECLEHYLNHRRVIVTRRTEFELEEARKRHHIVEGLIKAVDVLDEVIALIRASKNPEEAKDGLMREFKFTEIQAKAILDMRLARLTALELEALEDEFRELIKTIAALEEILSSKRRIDHVIKTELKEIRKKFADERRTVIIPSEVDKFEMEDLIPKQEVVITLSHAGYVKRLVSSTYRSQHRGGRGVMGSSLKEEDYITRVINTSTHHFLLFFTNRAKVYRLKAYEIPQAGRNARGTAIVNLIPLDKGEKITEMIPVNQFAEGKYLFMITKKGYVKKTELPAFSNIRKSGIYALNLGPDDDLVDVRPTAGDEELIIITKLGQALRFKEEQVRPMGRSARGVRGIRLRKGDMVVSLAGVIWGDELLVATDKGFGKRTPLADLKIYNRGCMGVKIMRVSSKVGRLIGGKVATKNDEIMLSTREGYIIRLLVNEISKMGRITSGVKLVNLEEGDEVTELTPMTTNLDLFEAGKENGNGNGDGTADLFEDEE